MNSQVQKSTINVNAIEDEESSMLVPANEYQMKSIEGRLNVIEIEDSPEKVATTC